MISYFLLNEQSRESIEAGRITKGPRFPHDCGEYRVQNKNTPEVAIAHDEGMVRRIYEKYSLCLIEPVRYGSAPGYRLGSQKVKK